MAQVPPSEYTLIRLFPDITFYRFTSDIVSITESCGGQSRTAFSRLTAGRISIYATPQYH